MTITEITAEQVAEKTTRVAFYCRVSTNSDDQIHSLATQIKYYTDFLKKHADYVLVDFYVDEGLTGTSLKRRDDMNRLIEDCRKGKIDHVVVKSVSRFARNVQELLEILRLFKSIGVTVYFEEQGIDTKKLNSEMLITFPGLAAQQESTVISENMRWSYSKRMAAGEFNCCTPAYGFQMVDGELQIKEEAVYDAFIMLMYKLKDKRKELLGTLIKQLIKLEECGTNCNNKIKTIDMSIAQLSAQNHTIAKLHNIGVLNSAEFSAKSAEINNKLTELRAERRKLISEDSNQALLDELNELNDIIKEYQYTPQFNQELFDKVVEKIIVIDNGTLQFNLMGGIKLAEKISERRRCQSA